MSIDVNNVGRIGIDEFSGNSLNSSPSETDLSFSGLISQEKTLDNLKLSDFQTFVGRQPCERYRDKKKVVQFLDGNLSIGNDFVGNIGRRTDNFDRNNDIRTAFYKAIKNEYKGDLRSIPLKVREALKWKNYEFGDGKATSGKPLTLRRIQSVITAINDSKINDSKKNKIDQTGYRIMKESGVDFKSLLNIFDEVVNSDCCQRELSIGLLLGGGPDDSEVRKKIMEKILEQIKTELEDSNQNIKLDSFGDLNEKFFEKYSAEYKQNKEQNKELNPRDLLLKEIKQVDKESKINEKDENKLLFALLIKQFSSFEGESPAPKKLFRAIFYEAVSQAVKNFCLERKKEQKEQIDFIDWPKKLQEAFGIDTYKYDSNIVTSKEELKFSNISDVIKTLKDLNMLNSSSSSEKNAKLEEEIDSVVNENNYQNEENGPQIN